jgi:hypothetical protein
MHRQLYSQHATAQSARSAIIVPWIHSPDYTPHHDAVKWLGARSPERVIVALEASPQKSQCLMQEFKRLLTGPLRGTPNDNTLRCVSPVMYSVLDAIRQFKTSALIHKCLDSASTVRRMEQVGDKYGRTALCSLLRMRHGNSAVITEAQKQAAERDIRVAKAKAIMAVAQLREKAFAKTCKMIMNAWPARTLCILVGVDHVRPMQAGLKEIGVRSKVLFAAFSERAQVREYVEARYRLQRRLLGRWRDDDCRAFFDASDVPGRTVNGRRTVHDRLAEWLT